MPLVSVIVPTYNRAHLLPESVGSVLAQDYPDVEIVVVDDGSTDNTEEVVRGFGERVKYVGQENSGVSVARNQGILHSRGDYLMFLDSDDILMPSTVRLMADALDANPEYGAAYCGFVETNGDGAIKYESPLDKPSGNVFLEMVSTGLCVVHSVMMRRQCLAKVGLFDASLSMYEDMDLNVRLAAHYNLVFVPQHLAYYRLAHCEQSKVTSKRKHQQDTYLRKMMRWREEGLLDRRGWHAVKRHIRGPKGGEKYMSRAYDAYHAGKWGEALPNAFPAAILKPWYLTTKSWWALVVKSTINLLKRR